MNLHLSRSSWACLGLLVLTACTPSEPKADHEAAADAVHAVHDASTREPAPARFKEGVGLILSAESQTALGVQTTEATEQVLPRQLRLGAYIIESTPLVCRAWTQVAPSHAPDLVLGMEARVLAPASESCP